MCVTDRDLESGCLVSTGSSQRLDATCQRSTTWMTTSSCRQPQTRDGDKSKLRDKGILKAVLNIIDVIAHKLLGMDVWEQQKSTGRWSSLLMGPTTIGVGGANPSANATLAIPVTVCLAGVAKSEVSLNTYISKSAGKATDKFMMPVLCFNVISGESRAGNLSACSEFLIVPTEAGSVAEDMIVDTEVYHLLRFGHMKDVRRDVCNVGNETGFSPSVQFNSETSNSVAESLELDQGVLPRCEWRVASCPSLIPIPKNVESKSCADACCGEQRSTHGRIKRAFGLLQNVKRSSLFNGTLLFCVSF